MFSNNSFRNSNYDFQRESSMFSQTPMYSQIHHMNYNYNQMNELDNTLISSLVNSQQNLQMIIQEIREINRLIVNTVSQMRERETSRIDYMFSYQNNVNNHIQPTFGSQTTTQPTFGSQTTTQPTFGRQTTTQPTFGRQTTTQPTFGSQTTTQPTFGTQTTTQPTFGTQTTTQPTFGSQTTTQPTFGRETTTQPTFGSQTTTQPTFGSQTTRQLQPTRRHLRTPIRRTNTQNLNSPPRIQRRNNIVNQPTTTSPITNVPNTTLDSRIDTSNNVIYTTYRSLLPIPLPRDNVQFINPSNLNLNLNTQMRNINRNIEDIISNFLEPIAIVPTRDEINAATTRTRFGELPEDVRENNPTCAIDLGTFENDDDVLQIRECGHVFGRDNLLSWFRRMPSCPICRHDIRENTRTNENTTTNPNNTTTSVINNLFNNILNDTINDTINETLINELNSISTELHSHDIENENEDNNDTDDEN
jgi:cell fate (sporulation/competence/biofilm development) regulator YlbF (YheA/YmcA/DUF963 family)